MTARESITVSFDPIPFTINAEMPDRDSRPPLVLASWAPPEFAIRYDYAPDQPDVAGKVLRGFALDAGTLALVVNVHGISMADLQDNRRALEVMFSQIDYTVTLTLDGEAEVYSAFPTWPTWEIDIPQRLAVATLSVPVNPLGV